ncbi:MAG: ATP-binding protein, partial [Nitrososphaeraceae archaeon]
MGESVKGQQEVLSLYPNGNGGKIPFHSRIGTKLIVGFLIIATITGSLGYLGLNYAQTVGEKFHLLQKQTLPTINSLGQMKVAALNIEGDTNEFFIPGINKDKVLQDLTEQKNKFNEGLNTYEDFVNKYFPDEKNLNEWIRNAASTFFQTSGKLVELGQSATPTLSPSPALEALTIEKETAENGLVKAIDTAITNEIDEVHDRSEAVDAAINISSLVTLSSIIVSVIVAVVFGLFFSRYISNPISNLKQASIQIGKGDYVTACKFLSKTHRGDEIGKLSSEIEKMRQSIESMKKNLDKLVEQRTKEVEKKNAELLEREKDLEKVNQELVTTELAKEEFISMVSHELKTPLTPLKMYVEMFLKSNRLGGLNEKQLKAMKMIHSSVSKLELLINDIFDVYKLDIGRLKLSKKPIEVTSLVLENISELEPITKDKQIQLNAKIIPPADGVNVLCDSKRIEQVISNLVKNSVDFVPEKGGKITIRAEADESYQNVIFTVEDNGIGIPLEKMDNLFKTFYQVDTTLARKHGGTGLGLVICKGIIEDHGGKIWIDRNFIGGTSIKFT